MESSLELSIEILPSNEALGDLDLNDEKHVLYYDNMNVKLGEAFDQLYTNQIVHKYHIFDVVKKTKETLNQTEINIFAYEGLCFYQGAIPVIYLKNKGVPLNNEIIVVKEDQEKTLNNRTKELLKEIDTVSDDIINRMNNKSRFYCCDKHMLINSISLLSIIGICAYIIYKK